MHYSIKFLKKTGIANIATEEITENPEGGKTASLYIYTK